MSIKGNWKRMTIFKLGNYRITSRGKKMAVWKKERRVMGEFVYVYWR